MEAVDKIHKFADKVWNTFRTIALPYLRSLSKWRFNTDDIPVGAIVAITDRLDRYGFYSIGMVTDKEDAPDGETGRSYIIKLMVPIKPRKKHRQDLLTDRPKTKDGDEPEDQFDDPRNPED